MPDVRAGITINDEDALDFLSSLIELEVEEDHRLATVARIKLTLTIGGDGTWDFLDDERVKLWNKLGITAVIDTDETELFNGYITQIRPHIVTDQNSCCIEIFGMDATSLMSVEEKIKDWPDQSDSDIASAIFGDYGLTPTVDSVDITHEEAVSTILQRETDIRFLKRLARRNGFECFVKGDTGYFRQPVLDDPPLPVLAAQFGAETNLISFHAKLNALRPTKVEMHQIDTITKEILDTSIESGELDTLGRDTAISVTAPEGHESRMFVKQSVATAQPEMEALSQALFDEAGWFMEGKGELNTAIYGSVLGARKLAPIKGVGESFSGIYYITNVKHIFNVGGYVQQFTARRNAIASVEGDFEAGGLLGGLV